MHEQITLVSDGNSCPNKLNGTHSSIIISSIYCCYGGGRGSDKIKCDTLCNKNRKKYVHRKKISKVHERSHDFP